MNRSLIAIALVAYARWAAAAAPAGELSEVIVTARRVEEDALRVPLSIDVVERYRLTAGDVAGQQSLASAVPGLSYESLWGGFASTPMIRGQSQPSAAGDNVGVFIDDVFQAAASSIDVEMLDFDRIEVVRGPQNTLFGRSTFAGAIHYVSRKPSEENTGYVQADLGTDGLAGVLAAWSGRLADSQWLGRIALGHQQVQGTHDSTRGESLGDSRSNSAVFTLARAANGAQSPVTLNVRLNRGEFGHPASSSLNAADYNCGARDATSGLWTYYCGRVPLADRFALTSALPDSQARSEQVSLRLEKPLGELTLRALSGYYHGQSTSYRDFDDSDAGLLSGVCTNNVNCGPGAAPLTRFASPNVVSRPVQNTTDWTQEIRLNRDADGISWMAGIAGSWTHALSSGAFGADRGDLQPNERLTALLVTNPNRVGPLSLLNAALVQDSREQQVVQSKDVETRGSLAAFGMVDIALAAHWHTRIELRAARETQQLDSRYVNFAPNPAPDPAQSEFSVLTPRFTFDFRPDSNWYAYASLARGARSGGTNTTPGLIAEEQQYDPEYNWTTELGLRHQSDSFLETWQATIYQIDWHDTQILGVATSPGVNSLIIANTAGLTTRGLEAQVQLRFGSAWRGKLGFSHIDAQFDRGSDDAGSRVFCGLTKQPPSSDFCVFGPPRTPSNGAVALVPYLDGNLPSRAPRDSGVVSLEALPRNVAGEWRLGGDVSFAWQDNVFERPINGASYGARHLLGARMVLQRGGWRVELWGKNLTDDLYIRAASSRGQQFYPSLPRPLDLLYSEGRRIGLTVTMNLGAQPGGQ